ncbi:ABC transporter permease [Sulfitobacter porphyrae]|uniref:ABC transporter permease n=1 Tax=Sulfitobacter porphyrae TaxID=1246864 RepID=A0ABW2B702_9RHOB|nr:sugar ABC transporter permease [Sulfitobacter porphyrae]
MSSVSQNGGTGAAGREINPGPTLRQFAEALLQGYGLVIALLLAIVLFSALRPEAFFSWTNARAILTLAAPLTIAALGLTAALVMNEIDLSVGSMIGLGGAFAVCLMSFWSVPWGIAIVAALALALAVGLATGLMVTLAGANSLIITLGMATLLTGLEFSLTNQRTIYAGIDAGYVALGQSMVLGLNLQVWIAGTIAIAMWVLLERSEAGRYMYATGSNREASFLAGLPVARLRVTGFVLVAALATVAGILLTAQSASAFSNAGQPYLLPAFAAAFLGSTVSGDGRFTVAGTVIAVLFIGVIQTGLTMLQLSTGAINIAQGGLLIMAVLLSRFGRRLRR